MALTIFGVVENGFHMYILYICNLWAVTGEWVCIMWVYLVVAIISVKSSELCHITLFDPGKNISFHNNYRCHSTNTYETLSFYLPLPL